MQSDDINIIVKTIGYTFYFGGLLWILSDDIGYLINKMIRLIKDKSSRISIKKKESAMDRSIRYLLAATFGDKSKITVFQFKMVTFILFCFFFVNCFRLMNVIIALIISLAMAAMPYLIIRLRLERLRSLSSNEAEILISELLIKYKIKNFNIEEAIEEVLKSKGVNNTRQLLSKLLMRLRTTRIDSELRDATNIFAYSINTNWARMLASNIHQSSKSGINVSLSMEDILIQLREARQLKEERKRNTAEPRRMLWSIPIFYFVLFLMSLNFMGLEVSHYLRNQFGTSQGVIMMCLILIGSLISYFFLSLLKSTKFDY